MLLKVVYDKPRTVYTARFLGDMNIFSGTVIGQVGHYAEIETPGECAVARVAVDDFAFDQDVCFGVRPERMKISLKPIEQKYNVVVGVVSDKVHRGREIIYEISLRHDIPKIHVLNLKDDFMTQDINIDDKAWVYWGDDAGVLLQTLIKKTP